MNQAMSALKDRVVKRASETTLPFRTCRNLDYFDTSILRVLRTATAMTLQYLKGIVDSSF